MIELILYLHCKFNTIQFSFYILHKYTLEIKIMASYFILGVVLCKNVNEEVYMLNKIVNFVKFYYVIHKAVV